MMNCEKAVSYPHGDILLEASGNVNIDTVEAIAQTGVDVISIGCFNAFCPML